MTAGSDDVHTSLSADEQRRLDSLQSAESLADLRTLFESETEHQAYLQARDAWQTLRQKIDTEPDVTTGIPGDCVTIDGQSFYVHGITHADTEPERTFLRRHVRDILDEDGTVYCEQGIRPMYFADLPGVCEIDDYRWAMHHCQQLAADSHIEGYIERAFDETIDGLGADLATIASQFREATFSVIESGTEVYGNRFAQALGDVASDFLMDHTEIGTVEDFASFSKSKTAAQNPDQLVALQEYYNTVLLPQPLEREWLRRHDRELELFTHARNERIASYALYHGLDSDPVHLIVGAAHQPGVVYYLEGYRDDEWDFGEFEYIP